MGSLGEHRLRSPATGFATEVDHLMIGEQYESRDADGNWVLVKIEKPNADGSYVATVIADKTVWKDVWPGNCRFCSSSRSLQAQYDAPTGKDVSKGKKQEEDEDDDEPEPEVKAVAKAQAKAKVSTGPPPPPSNPPKPGGGPDWSKIPEQKYGDRDWLML